MTQATGDGPLTADEKIEEASIESMVASDPPGYLSIRSGAPAREPDEDSVQRLAYKIWEREGRPEGGAAS